MYIQDIQNVMPAQTRKGILGSNHGQGEAMDMVHRLLILDTQVVVVAGFTPVEEVERISMGPRDMVERVLTAKFLAVLQPKVTSLKPSGNTSPFFVSVLHHVTRRASKYHRVQEEDPVARLSAHLFLQLHVLS